MLTLPPALLPPDFLLVSPHFCYLSLPPWWLQVEDRLVRGNSSLADGWMDGWMDACELSATASPVSQQSQKTANRIELNCFLRWDGTGPDSD